MSGDPELRHELDAAMAIPEPAAYYSRLIKLKQQFGHAISLISDRGNNFNCFAYAFGISDDPEFRALVIRTRMTAVMNSQFVQAELTGGALVQIDASTARRSDIALYFAGDVLTHAARIERMEPPLLLQSKWGPSELHAHSIWEVPASYGNMVRYFRAPDAEGLLDRLLDYAEP